MTAKIYSVKIYYIGIYTVLKSFFLNGRYGCVKLISYAQFLRYSYSAANNKWEPVKLSDDLLENSFPNKIYSPVIPVVTFDAHVLLMLSNPF